MTQSISGLASGLDTTSIINSLMQIEAQPQTDLKNQLSAQQSQLKELQSLNSSFLSLYNAAQALIKPTDWAAYKATSSSADVTATTTAGATAGSLSFTVNSVAVAHSLTFTNSAALTDVVTGASTVVNLTDSSGTTVSIDSGDGTLGGLVSAINNANAGVHASTVKLSDGTYRLSVTSNTTGAASAFTLTDSSGAQILGGATVSQGADASITSSAGDVLTSSTNSFTGVFSGVDVTLGSGVAAGTNVTITVSQDTTSLTDKIQALVDSANKLIDQMGKDTAYNSATKTSGVLSGMTGIQRLATGLADSVFPGGTSSMADYGLQVDRDGHITFDKTKFESAYTANPQATVNAFTDGAGNGFIYRLSAAADLGSNADTGILTNAISSENSGIRDLQDQISSWDTRLALKKQSLQAQFTNLETALAKMKSQGDWLAGQIASLPSYGTSTSGG